MATIGIGSRVMVGWAPASECRTPEYRLTKGTVELGPFAPGERLPDQIRDRYGYRIQNGYRDNKWTVRLDCGRLVNADEHLLIPLDDDPPVVDERDTEKESKA